MRVRHRGLRRGATAVVTAALMVLTLAGAAQASTKIHVVATFDESQHQNTEGVTVDRSGNVYVSVSPLGDLWKFPARSTEPEPFGHVSGIVAGRDFGLLGLAVDEEGNVYGGVQSADPNVNGVYEFDAQTGDATRLSGTAAIGLANGLTFDHAGNLYVTDSVQGEIWRIKPGGTAKVWLKDDALAGTGVLNLGVPLGVNGIAYRQHLFTVTNSEKRTVLTIPKVDGHAGTIRVLTTLPAGDEPDGVQLDIEGNAYVALNLANEVAMVSPNGSPTVLASGDPLDFPSSLAFDLKSGHRDKLYGVNFSVGEMFGQPSGPGPALWWIRAEARGVVTP